MQWHSYVFKNTLFGLALHPSILLSPLSPSALTHFNLGPDMPDCSLLELFSSLCFNSLLLCLLCKWDVGTRSLSFFLGVIEEWLLNTFTFSFRVYSASETPACPWQKDQLCQGVFCVRVCYCSCCYHMCAGVVHDCACVFAAHMLTCGFWFSCARHALHLFVCACVVRG